MGCFPEDATTAAPKTEDASTTALASTTTMSDDYFIEGYEGCCRTWTIRNGEFKAYCEHKKSFYSQSEWWVYECIGITGGDIGKSLSFQ